jgi:hypothetical protein
MLADRNAEIGIEAAASGDKHARFVERLGCRQAGQLRAPRGQGAHAPRYGGVKGAHTQRRAEPPHETLGRGLGGDGQRIRKRRGRRHRACGR